MPFFKFEPNNNLLSNPPQTFLLLFSIKRNFLLHIWRVTLALCPQLPPSSFSFLQAAFLKMDWKGEKFFLV